MQRIDLLKPELFLDGPAEYLVKVLCEEIGNIKPFRTLFGEFIDPYRREDYGMANLPALRVYSDRFAARTESWFVDGNISCDILMPPSLRRKQLEQVSDTVAAAMLQYFRSPEYFGAITERVPALNELGKTFEVDKTLALAISETALVPMTQVLVNYRIDLREWDLYLESENRTKETPFERTLGNLTRIVTSIRGVDDDGAAQVDVGIDQEV